MVRFKLMSPVEVLQTAQKQAEALAALPESILLLHQSLRSFAQTIARLDGLVQRMDRLTEPLEAPLAALAPRLEAVGPLLDAELLASLPEFLQAVQRTGLPALELIGQTQDQVASIANSVDRLMHLMDDTMRHLQDIPGVTLVSRLRGGPARTADNVAGAPVKARPAKRS